MESFNETILEFSNRFSLTFVQRKVEFHHNSQFKKTPNFVSYCENRWTSSELKKSFTVNTFWSITKVVSNFFFHSIVTVIQGFALIFRRQYFSKVQSFECNYLTNAFLHVKFEVTQKFGCSARLMLSTQLCIA